MASSDDEDEALPLSVSNYYFEDDKDEHASFADLPIQWAKDDITDGKNGKLFLRGSADNGLQSIHKHVVAWMFDLSCVNPQISVLSKENSWIKLEKPRKVFEGVVRPVMVTVQCLHYAQRNPDASRKSLWDHLAKIFRPYEVVPSEKDLKCHVSLITEAIERNEALAKSKFLAEFLKKEPEKIAPPDEGVQAKPMSNFIVSDSDDGDDDSGEDDESDEVDELFDYACAICDNGGDLLCCEGRCLRSFHACEEAAEDCESLGFTEEEANALTSQTSQEFLCKNCKFKKHQCFVCGKLGSSDESSGAEVFRCVSATCGRFYHPNCVAKMIHMDCKASVEETEKRIAEGGPLGSFICPVHKCCACPEKENKNDHDLQFAVCRRCPKSYHRKCLPKKILFEENKESGLPQRAWEDLLPNRILIYCLDHEIVKKIGTPVRNHIKFPGDGEKKSSFAKKKITIDEKRHKQTSQSLGEKKKIESKTRVHLKETRQERTTSAVKQTKMSSSGLRPGGDKSSGKLVSGSSILRRVKVNDGVKKELKSSRFEENKTSRGNRSSVIESDSSEGEEDTENEDLNMALVDGHDTNLSSGLPKLDADSEKRVLDIMERAKSSIKMDDIRKKRIIPSTHGSSLKYFDEKSISLGKVETSVQAVREALRILEEGGYKGDAQEVCSEKLLTMIQKWNQKLRLHISPFLHGKRYTSYGRHFTKLNKLEEIVNRLHWYLQDGDMLVDFCCGQNDFSVLMKKKLEETGKKCSFKNYDILPPKNYFNFEQRDWMTVKPEELPTGSKLVMGLNPPFGLKAKRLISKALEFNPKLLILIVPSESQRLDEKETPYDLIWEDDTLLSGMSFFLPGSIDARDKQMEQWNKTPPPLCLWSHPEWSVKHRSIAKALGHISKLEVEEAEERNHDGPMIPYEPAGSHDEVDHDVYDLPLMGVDEDHAIGSPQAMDEKGHHNYPVETDNLNETEDHKTSSPSGSNDNGSPRNHGHGKKTYGERSRKRPRINGTKNERRSHGRVSKDRRRDDERPPVREVRDTRTTSYVNQLDIFYDPDAPAPHPPPRAYDNGFGSRSPIRELHDPSMALYRGINEGIHHLPDHIIDRHYFSDRVPSEPSTVTNYGSRHLDGHRFIPQPREATGGLNSGYLDEGIRSQARHYKQQGQMVPVDRYSPSQNMVLQHLAVAPFSSGYGPMSSVQTDSSYGISPTSQTQMPLYHPGSDELRQNRMSNFGAEPVQPPDYRNAGFYSQRFSPPRPPHHGPTSGSSGFASGQHDSYQHHGWGGWIP